MRLPRFFQLPISFTLIPQPICQLAERRARNPYLAAARLSVLALILGGCAKPPESTPFIPPLSMPPRDAIPWDAPFPTDLEKQDDRWTEPLPPWHEFRLVGRKDAVGDNWMPLRLLEPMTGQWELAAGGGDTEESAPDETESEGASPEGLASKSAVRPAAVNRPVPAAVANVDPSDLRVEIRLMPRSLPRWRLVGSSTLNAAQDSTWIEFIQSQSDQVLKLKVDCRWTKGLELLVAAHFQLAPELPTVQLTQRNLFQAEQFTTGMGQRLTAQLHWISARTAGGGASGNKTAAANLNDQKKQIEKQLKQVTIAAQRLEHLKSLQQTLEQEGRLHVRLVHATTGQELKITPVGQASSLSPAPPPPPAPKTTSPKTTPPRPPRPTSPQRPPQSSRKPPASPKT